MDTAADVVSGRDNRYRLARYVNAQFKATPIDSWKMLPEKGFWLVRYVQKHTIKTTAFHFKVDCSSNDISRSQFSTRVMLWHERRPVRQSEHSAFTPYRFGDEK